MHWLDITILVALGIGAGFGFWSGLLWQVARVLSLVLALYAAISANPYAADWVAEQWPDTGSVLCKIAAFVAIFLFVYVLLYLVTRMLHQAIKATKLELLDRILGALLGMAKMAAVVSAICAGIAAVGIPLTRDWMGKSSLAPAFARGTDVAVSLIPKEYRERLDENVQEARDQLQKKATDVAMDALKK